MTGRVAAIDSAIQAVEHARAVSENAQRVFTVWIDGSIDTVEWKKAEHARGEALAEASDAVRRILNIEPWVSPVSPHVLSALYRARDYLISAANGQLPSRVLDAEERRGLKRLIDEATRAKTMPGGKKTSSDTKGFDFEIDDTGKIIHSFGEPGRRKEGDWIPLGRGGVLTDAILEDHDSKIRVQHILRWWASEDTSRRTGRPYDGKRRGRFNWYQRRVGYKDPEPLS